MDDGKFEQPIKLRRKIGVFGGVAVNVGIEIGSGIFLTPKGVLQGSGSIGLSIIIWFLSGIFFLVGALCLAELGTMIPSHGGINAYVQYVYDPILSFLVQWISIMIVLPGSIAIAALTFASYAIQPFYPDLECSPPPNVTRMLAITCVIFVSVVNALSVRAASFMQETFTIMKMVALVIIIGVGIIELGKGNTENFEKPFEGSDARGLGTAFYSGLFAYAGCPNVIKMLVSRPTSSGDNRFRGKIIYTRSEEYVDMEPLLDIFYDALRSYHSNSAENLPRCIIISVLLVTILYVFTNVAYFTVITKDEILASNAVAATFGGRSLGNFSWIISLSVAVSTFGTINGNILATSRTVFAGARDHHLPMVAALIHPSTRTPIPAIIITAFTTCMYILVDDVFIIINYFSFFAWSSMALASVILLYLRWKEPNAARPYKVNISLPISFLVACIVLVVMGTIAAPIDTLIGLALACTGLPMYFLLVKPKKLPTWYNNLIALLTDTTKKLLQVVEAEKDY